MQVYPKGHLVWAKIKGYPWWPGVIAKSNQEKNGNIGKDVIINFVGEDSHASLPVDKIYDFTEFFKKFASQKNKKLQSSIKIALKIKNGVTTFDEHDKMRLHSRGYQDISDSEEEVSPAKPKKVKKKAPSPAKKKVISKTGRKAKEKEMKNQPEESEDSEDDDFKGTRVTRAVAKKDNVEIITQPIIYKSKKGEQSNSKSATKQTPSKGAASKKKGKAPSSSAKKRGQSANNVAIESDDESDNRSQTPDQKGSSPAHVAQKGGAKKKKGGYQAQKIEPEEDDESSDQGSVTSKRSRGRTLMTTKVNSKRLVSSRGDEQVTYTTGRVDRRNLTNEPLSKKRKSDELSDIPDEDELVESSAEKIKPVIGYNNATLRRFENQLESSLGSLAKKFNKKEKLKENDEELVKLKQTANEFDKSGFTGAELISSDSGRIVKTAIYLIKKNKEQIQKQATNLTNNLEKILEGMKRRVLKVVFDNSEYLESYASDRIAETIGGGQQSSKQNKFDQMINEAQKREQKADHEETKTSGRKANRNSSGKESASKSKQSAQQDPKGPDGGVIVEGEEVKKEDVNHLLLRKKVCQKLAKMIQVSFDLEKEKAQELTLIVEGKINSLFQNAPSEYKTIIRSLYKLIKCGLINISEVNQIENMDYRQFNQMVSSRISKVPASEQKEGGKVSGKNDVVLIDE